MNYTKDISKTIKKKYKVKNWKEYNKSLIQRGSLTILIPGNINEEWHGGGRYTYSDKAIEVMLLIKARYHLPLRATVGFVSSLLHLPIPDYTTISRRARTLKLQITKSYKTKVNMNLDSSGMKVYGEGEWKVRQHGWGKRRTWTKIHIADDDDREIRAVITTSSDTHDSEVIDDILKQEEADIDAFRADGAYDGAPVYMSVVGRGITSILIPPRHDAKIRIHGNSKGPPYVRDENVRAIRKTSRTQWKCESGYHMRSGIENTMYRFKITFGERLSFRNLSSQSNEVVTKCNILNLFHRLGMPESYIVAET